MTEAQTAARSHMQTEQVDSLIAAAGVDGARSILEAFQRSTVELLRTLSEGLASGALTDAYRTAHAVKGSAANVGAQLLAETASAIEAACKAGDSAKAASMLADAQAKFDAFIVHFDAHLEQF
ncbi:MAG: Hpt domain-containing protein [Parvularculaceae bacterium]